MNNHRLHIFLIATLILAGVSSLAQSTFRFQRYGREDGLADFARSIEQDSLGYIWIQNSGGLSRFDGYNFKIYKYDPNDNLRSALSFVLGPLLKDASNNIWLTEHKPGKGDLQHSILVKYDRGTDGFIKYEIDLNGKYARKYIFEKDGTSVWIGTSNGLINFNFSTGQTQRFLNPHLNDSTAWLQNQFIGYKDLGSSILFSTPKGLWLFDKVKKVFSRPIRNPRDSALLYDSVINRILDSPNVHEPFTWLISGNSLFKIDTSYSIVQKFDLPIGVTVKWDGWARDREGVFWLPGGFASSEGLYRYDPEDSSFTNLKNDPGDPFSISSNEVFDVTVDRDQNVWVATENGTNVLRRQDLRFYNKKLKEGVIWANSIYKSKDSEYLILNVQKASDRINSNTSEILMSPIIVGHPDSLNFQPILDPINDISLRVYQGKNTFWISSLEDGVVGYPIDPKTGMIAPGRRRTFRHDEQNPYTISDNIIANLWEDSNGDLWVAHQPVGIDQIRFNIPYGKKGSVVRYGLLGQLGGFAYHENEKAFWIIDKGASLIHLPANHADTASIERVFESQELIVIMFKARDGTLFIGTMNALYAATKENGNYKFNKTPLLKDISVNSVREDEIGRLWIYSDSRIVCYDRQNNSIAEFDQRDGLDHFGGGEQNWMHQTSEGIMVVVSPDGLSLFDPSTFEISSKRIVPVFTKLEINNLPLVGAKHTSDSAFTISADIGVLNELVLDYRHNNFTIEFAAMEMTAPEKNFYRYRLDGYNDEWIETDYKKRTATYTNLPAGDYTFRIKASNHHGVWSDQERTLKVKILPAPWRTSWAYTGYGLLFLGALYAARRNLLQRERLKANLKLEQVAREKEHFELEKAHEVDRVKTSFFTNISHEFRTPLTLIKGPVETLLDRFKDDPDVAQRLKLVQRNSEVLLRLINQLLDLAKLESGTMKVEKSNSDINSFIRAIAGSFESLARHKNVTLSVEISADHQQMVFDKDKLETILINLINNAIKFTPSGGNVQVQAACSNNSLTIVVRDTGIGIPVEHQEKIFERFHQVSEAHKEIGTGIGLSLVKELIELLEGTITVCSEPGKGTTFTVIIPVEAATDTSEVLEELAAPLSIDHGHSNNQFHAQPSHNGEPERPHVLVVEDNDDLRAFIIDSLGQEFYFLEADNGRAGLELAINEIPDLIVSDVMMPEMDGITMAGKVKTDHRSSHIPLILLTAKSTEDSKLQGLKSGADDYLTKPFNREELLLKVRNSISRQIKLREKLRAEVMGSAPTVEVMSEDERFLIRVKEKILERLSDEQLSVESLADDIGISRVHLYRKVSGLTGLSVNELIRKLRLQRAAQLIGQHWGPVSQVAYEVGYSNLSYFSKVFKEEFGMLPSEYSYHG